MSTDIALVITLWLGGGVGYIAGYVNASDKHRRRNADVRPRRHHR
jgi:hypothetical protein